MEVLAEVEVDQVEPEEDPILNGSSGVGMKILLEGQLKNITTKLTFILIKINETFPKKHYSLVITLDEFFRNIL